MFSALLKSMIFATRPLRYGLDERLYKLTKLGQPIAALKGKCKGKPLLIVGNGPSLNQTPLDRFTGITSIGMNKIDLLYPRVSWRPDLVVCTNNLVAGQNWKKFLEHRIPVYLSWRTRWFIPSRARKEFNFFVERLAGTFSEDCSQWIGGGATVTYAALQLAYYMEADPVIIVGVDHSFQSVGKPQEIRRREGADHNHFDPNYFAHGQLWGVPNLDASEHQYQLARQAIEKAGRRVYDATVGGKLQIFDKISIDQAVELCGA